MREKSFIACLSLCATSCLSLPERPTAADAHRDTVEVDATTDALDAMADGSVEVIRSGDASDRCGRRAGATGLHDPTLFRWVTGPLWREFGLKGARIDGAGRIYAYGTNRFGCGGRDDYDGVVYRLTPSGDLDVTFGDHGRVCVGERDGDVQRHDVFFDLAMLGDGRLVLAGQSSTPTTDFRSDGLLVWLRADGSLDARAGDAGTRRYASPASDPFSVVFYGLAVDGDRVFAAGGDEYPMVPSRLGFAMAVGADRALDSGFDGDGVWVDHAAAGYSAVAFVAGDVVVAGMSARDGHPRLVRLVHDGAPSPTFGVGGVATTPTPGATYVRAMQVTPEGQFVVAGALSPEGDLGALTVARFDRDGRPDTAFGVDGVRSVSLAWQRYYQFGSCLALQCSGEILAGAVARSETEVFVVRLTPSGAVDATFGLDGALPVKSAAGAYLTGGASVLVDPRDGRVVVVTARDTGDGVGLWRFYP